METTAKNSSGGKSAHNQTYFMIYFMLRIEDVQALHVQTTEAKPNKSVEVKRKIGATRRRFFLISNLKKFSSVRLFSIRLPS